MRRVLYITREEYAHLISGSAQSKPGSSLYMLGSSALELDYNSPIENIKDVKNAILTSITELIDELQNIYRNIADQAIEHIHAKYTPPVSHAFTFV